MTFYKVKQNLDDWSHEEIDHLVETQDLTKEQAEELKAEKYDRELGILLAEERMSQEIEAEAERDEHVNF